jgi:hypothetical protein
LVGEATIVEAEGVLGIELNRLIEIGNGAVEFALGSVSRAAIVEDKRVGGIELDDGSSPQSPDRSCACCCRQSCGYGRPKRRLILFDRASWSAMRD